MRKAKRNMRPEVGIASLDSTISPLSAAIRRVIDTAEYHDIMQKKIRIRLC